MEYLLIRCLIHDKLLILNLRDYDKPVIEVSKVWNELYRSSPKLMYKIDPISWSKISLNSIEGFKILGGIELKETRFKRNTIRDLEFKPKLSFAWVTL